MVQDAVTVIGSLGIIVSVLLLLRFTKLRIIKGPLRAFSFLFATLLALSIIHSAMNTGSIQGVSGGVLAASGWAAFHKFIF